MDLEGRAQLLRWGLRQQGNTPNNFCLRKDIVEYTRDGNRSPNNLKTMSSVPENLDQSAYFEGRATFENDEEALQTLAEMKDMDFGDYFTSRSTNLGDEESQGISLSFYHDEVDNFLRLSTESENELRIRLNLENDDVSSVREVIGKVLSEVGPITQEDVIAYKRYDISFGSLDTPIEDDPDLEINGLKLTAYGSDIIIQEIGDAKIAVQLRNAEEQEYEEQLPDDFYSRYFVSIESLIEGDLQ